MEKLLDAIKTCESFFELPPLKSTSRLFYGRKNVSDFPFDAYLEYKHSSCASLLESGSTYSEDAIIDLLSKGAQLVKYEMEKPDSFLFPGMGADKKSQDFSIVLFYDARFYCFWYDEDNHNFGAKSIFIPKLCPNPLETIEQFALAPTHKSKISVFVQDCGEIVARSITLEGTEKVDLNLNYGKGFLPVHDRIVDKLSNQFDGGLYMFHGEPGTGKSTYIRHLTSLVEREFIFIPCNAVDMLTSPALLTTLLRHKNSVLVIEDAEKAIESRENSENASLVSALLNMSDGILGSLLKISLIVTYNCERGLIDPALLRKGRLVQDYGFRNLSIEDSQALIDSLNIDYEVTTPMSLAEIYNISEETGYQKPEEKRMGFGA
jgi:hypothetical protein